MPRFDNEGFNPNKRIENDNRDRSVPEDENYYGKSVLDDSVIDNQMRDDYVDISSYSYEEKEEYAPIVQFEEMLPRKEKPQRKPVKPKKVIKSVVAIVLALAIIACGTVASAFSKITFDDNRKNQYVSASDLIRDRGVKNILLLGVDARNPDDDTASRSDTMMLVSIDTKHNCIKMVSFLRDTWVYIPALDAKQRLNAACSADGYNGVVDTIEYNFGIDIDGFVVADFEMFKVLVDSIGGVEVEVTEAEAEEVNSHQYRYDGVTMDSGAYKLTGEQALAYCRIRKIDTDFQRALRQRTVMQSILGEVKHANPLKLLIMATKCAKYIETSLSVPKIMSIGIKALGCLGTMAETRVPFDGTWKYSNIGGASVITIDVDENKSMLIDALYNKSAEDLAS